MAKIKASHIKCGVCGTKFRSPNSLGDTEAFQSATLVGNTASCPDCGRMIYRRVNPRKINAVCGDLDIAVTQAGPRIEEITNPNVNCDSSEGDHR